MTTRDLDAALASFFEREATADGAATILEAALEQTSRRRPRPAWVTAVRGVTVGPTLALDPRTRSRIGYALVLAALLAAIVVGALFLAGTRPPRLSESRPCVGQPATLCGHTAGVWTSESFLPGLTLTWPNDGWYTRDLPGQLEVKTLPMTSAVIVHLDPLPAGRDPGTHRRRGEPRALASGHAGGHDRDGRQADDAGGSQRDDVRHPVGQPPNNRRPARGPLEPDRRRDRRDESLCTTPPPRRPRRGPCPVDPRDRVRQRS